MPLPGSRNEDLHGFRLPFDRQCSSRLPFGGISRLLPGCGRGQERRPDLLGGGKRDRQLFCGCWLRKRLGSERLSRSGESRTCLSKCVPAEELLPKAWEVADKLAAGPQNALRLTKRALNGWLRMAGPIFDNSLAYEMLNFLEADAKEGIAALKEKRPPKFQGS